MHAQEVERKRKRQHRTYSLEESKSIKTHLKSTEFKPFNFATDQYKEIKGDFTYRKKHMIQKTDGLLDDEVKELLLVMKSYLLHQIYVIIKEDNQLSLQQVFEEGQV